MQPSKVGKRSLTGFESELPPVRKRGGSPQRSQRAAERSGISGVSENDPVHTQVKRTLARLEAKEGLDVSRAVANVKREELFSPKPSLEEVGKDLELLAEMYPDTQLLPRGGMPVSAGERRYWIQSVSLEAKEETFRLHSLQGGSWQEVDRIIIASRKEGFFCTSQKGGTKFSPAVRECLTACSQKLQTMSVMYLELTNNNVEDTTARKIVMQWADQWRGCFVEPSDPSVTILQQYRGSDRIKGLKVGGAAGRRYADYSLGKLQSGSIKNVKREIRIFPNGFIKHFMRLAKIDEATKGQFIEDVQREVSVRQSLIEEGEKKPDLDEEMRNSHINEYIVAIERVPSHIGRGGEVKFRYLGQLAKQDLFEETDDPEIPLPDVIRACLNPLKGLRFMHVRGYAHSDVKTENMLVFGRGEGKLADLGFAGPVGGQLISGTPDYLPPEVIEGKERLRKPSQDMFSFGVSLLWIIASRDLPLRGISSKNTLDVLCKTSVRRYSKSVSLKSHHDLIEGIQTILRKAPENPEYHLLYHLIADLLSYDPSERPDSTEAKRRLNDIVAALPQ